MKRKLKTGAVSKPEVPTSKPKLESQPLAASTVAEPPPHQTAIALSEASAKEAGLEAQASVGEKMSSELSSQTTSGQLDVQSQECLICSI